MVENNESHLSKEVVSRIAFLRNLSKEHLKMIEKIMRADKGNVFGVDLVILAVIQRSISLIDGFTVMLERRNVLCAAPLIRLQVDSIMRLYACWLVDDPHSIALRLLEGAPLSKVNSRDGKPLNDKYLHKEVSKIYPWVSRVYQKTSGFIHLSLPHMMAPVKSVNHHERAISVSIGNTGRKWTKDEMIEAIDAFTEATKSLLHLCYSWLVTKETEGANRKNAEPSV